MPVIRYGDEYALIVSDGKLENRVLYSIIREPHFQMKLEAVFAALMMVLGLSICFRSPEFASFVSEEILMPSLSTFAIGAVIFTFGLYWAYERVYAQYLYRSGRIGGNVDVLTQGDYFWHSFTNTVCDWPLVAKEIEQQTLLGRSLEGIILKHLCALSEAFGLIQLDRSDHRWVIVAQMNGRGFAAAREVSDHLAYCHRVKQKRTTIDPSHM